MGELDSNFSGKMPQPRRQAVTPPAATPASVARGRLVLANEFNRVGLLQQLAFDELVRRLGQVDDYDAALTAVRREPSGLR